MGSSDSKPRLAELMRQDLAADNTTGKRGARAAFTILRDQIEEALADGHPIKAVWEKLRQTKQLNMSYGHFAVLCRELRKNPPPPPPGARPPGARPPRETRRPIHDPNQDMSKLLPTKPKQKS